MDDRKGATFFYHGARPLVLASSSPRRRMLLESVGAAFRVVEPDFPEVPLENPEASVMAHALFKAEEVAARIVEAGPALVIGADTLVVVDGRGLGKPSDSEDAVRMLLALSGREHRVMTGIAVAETGGRHRVSMEITEVRMRGYDEAEACAYVATGEPMDKAGAYGIQGLGGLLVEWIRGDYANVVGLPLGRLRLLLMEIEAMKPEKGEGA